MTQLDIDTKARMDARWGTDKAWVVLWETENRYSVGTSWTEAKGHPGMSRWECHNLIRRWRQREINVKFGGRPAINCRIVPVD